MIHFMRICRTYCCLPNGEDNGELNNRGLRDVGENSLLLAVRNVGITRTGVNGEEPCCVQEGYAPEDNEVCYQEMALLLQGIKKNNQKYYISITIK